MYNLVLCCICGQKITFHTLNIRYVKTFILVISVWVHFYQNNILARYFYFHFLLILTTQVWVIFTTLDFLLILRSIFIYPVLGLFVHIHQACLTVVHPQMVYSHETNRSLCFRLILHAISQITMATNAGGKQSGCLKWCCRKSKCTICVGRSSFTVYINISVSFVYPEQAVLLNKCPGDWTSTSTKSTFASHLASYRRKAAFSFCNHEVE